MSRIDRPDQLAALIRAQIAAAQRTAPSAGPSGSREIGKRPGRTASPTPDLGQQGKAEDATSAAPEILAQRIRALRPEDPQRRRKAFRLFLESVLLQELGAQLANDAGFDTLVERVLRQMESDSALQASIDEAADILLAEGGPASG